jgi:hypothetical protein
LNVLQFKKLGAPEVSPVARRHTPNEAFALDNASARGIIGARWGQSALSVWLGACPIAGLL